jgi:LysR family transcriptional regulator, transcriptional activator for dmlA
MELLLESQPPSKGGGAPDLGLVHFDYYPALNGSHYPPIGKYGGGMLDDITGLRTFVRIVAAGSLSAASREMGLALSVVSKRLATLERRAEVRLIARGTRSLALTEGGQHLFERAQRILAEVDEAEAALTRGRAEPEGVLRVSAPHALGRAHVSPVCRDLVRAYPKISAELILTDRFVELIDERMDVVVRISVLRVCPERSS